LFIIVGWYHWFVLEDFLCCLLLAWTCVNTKNLRQTECLPVHFPDFEKSFFKPAAASYWGKMPRNKRSNGFAVGNSIEEEVKMAVGMSVRDFMNDHSRMELSFPSSLTREQRAFVHQLVSG
jgi:hypothetical protein